MRWYDIYKKNKCFHSTSLNELIEYLLSDTLKGRAHSNLLESHEHVIGTAFTRDLSIAEAWGDFILVFDEPTLMESYKILPVDLPHDYSIVAEEFVIGNIETITKYLDKIILSNNAKKQLSLYTESVLRSNDLQGLLVVEKIHRLSGLYEQTYLLERKIDDIKFDTIMESDNSIIKALKKRFGPQYDFFMEHLRRFKNEMKETSEVGKMLFKASKGQKLTSDEKTIIVEQFKDLARMVWMGWPQLQPLPFVSLLWIPIAIKVLNHLGIDHRPSAWRDEANADITENAHAPLYHGMKYNHLVQALKADKLEGRTSQRFWGDGRRRTEDDPEYRNSYWMKGFSLTRDKKYAMGWSDTCLVLDQELLRQRFSIEPYAWNYHYSGKHGRRDHKKEREEFLITKKSHDSYQLKPEYPGDDEKRVDINRLKSPEGEIKPLSKYLLGFYVDQEYAEAIPDNPDMKYLLSHPKFKGLYTPNSSGGFVG